MPTKLNNLGGIANGTIAVSTFVSADYTINAAFIQSSGTLPILGVSQQGPREPAGLQVGLFPGTTPTTNPAAIAGDALLVFFSGDICPLLVGSGTIGPGDLLTNDGNGAGLTAVQGNGTSVLSGRWLGAMARESGNPGDYISVLVINGRS